MENGRIRLYGAYVQGSRVSFLRIDRASFDTAAEALRSRIVLSVSPLLGKMREVRRGANRTDWHTLLRFTAGCWKGFAVARMASARVT